MSYGYSQYTITANKSADKRLIGVALGRACIAKGIAVSAIAKRFGVSRQTVYNWFEGKHVPKQELLRPIAAYVANLTK
jgi:transcriptional regulator with XRE-family HTH domain